MGFSSEQIFQIGLNFAGYLTAGILTAVVYSLWTNRSRTVKAEPSKRNSKEAQAPTSASTVFQSPKDIEFIDLTGNAVKAAKSTRASAAPKGYRTRDRQEIIRLAKEMLAQRQSKTEIQKSLPVTSGEISFLKQRLNLQGIARNR